MTQSEAEHLNKLENLALTPRVRKLFRSLDAQGATAEERRAAIKELLLASS